MVTLYTQVVMWCCFSSLYGFRNLDVSSICSERILVCFDLWFVWCLFFSHMVGGLMKFLKLRNWVDIQFGGLPLPQNAFLGLC